MLENKFIIIIINSQQNKMESDDEVIVHVIDLPEHVDFEQPVAAYEELNVNDEDEPAAVLHPVHDLMDVEHIAPLNQENNENQEPNNVEQLGQNVLGL